MDRCRVSLLFAACLFTSTFGCGAGSATDQPHLVLDAGPADADALLVQAKAALEVHDVDAAIEIAGRALAKDPDNVAFLLVRGDAYDEANRLADALTDYQRVLRSDPRHPSALCGRASIYGDYDRLDDACADLRAALTADPGSAEAHANLAYFLFNQDSDANAAQVEAEFDAALHSDPKCPGALRARLVYRLERNEIDKARQDLAKLKEQPRQAGSCELFEGLLCLMTNEPEQARNHFEHLVHHPLANRRHYGHTGLALYHKLVTKDPRLEIAELARSLKIRPNASMLLRCAGLHYDAKEYSEAIADVTEYLRFNPRGSSKAFATRADSFANIGRQLEALDDSKRLCDLEPTNFHFRWARARAGVNLLHTQDALVDMNECVRLKPESAQARRNRAMRLAELGQLDAALKDLDDAAKLHPDGPYVESDLHADRAVYLLAANRPETALAEARAALRLYPDWPGYRYLLAFALFRSNQLEKAIECLDDYLRLKPDEVYGLAARAACLARLGKTAEAAAEIARIRKEAPDPFGEMALRDVGHAEGFGLPADTFAKLGMVDALVRQAPENLLLRIYRARRLMLSGKDREAIADCDFVLRKDPKCWLAVSLRANARCESEPAQAIADCDLGTSMCPAHAGFAVARGIAHRKLGDLAAAIRDFDEAIRLRPCAGRAYALRGETWRRLAEPKKAEADLSMASALGAVPFMDPCDARFWEQFSASRQDEASNLLGRIDSACRDHRNAEFVRLWAEYRRHGYPQNIELHTRISQFLLQAGRGLEALALLNESIRTEPRDAAALALRGYTHLALQHWQPAVDDLSESLRLAPDQDTAFIRRGFSRMALGPCQSAIDDFDAGFAKTSTASVTETASAYRNRAYCRLRGPAAKEALADLAMAVKIEPKNLLNHYALAFGRYRCGDPKGALDALDEAAWLHPFGNGSEALAARGACLTKLGLATEAAVQFAKAKTTPGGLGRTIADFDASIAQDPKNVLALACRARLRLASGEADRALADCDKALELDPDCVAALAVRAEAFAESDPARALADCDRGLRLQPTSGTFPIHRSVARFRKGDFAGSLADLDEAIRRQPWVGKLYRLRAKTLEALHEKARAIADLARADEWGEFEFTSPEELDRLLSGSELAIQSGIEPLPQIEAPTPPSGLATIAPPPSSNVAAIPGSFALKATPVSLVDGWTAPKVEIGKSNAESSRFLAPGATAGNADKSAPPPPLVVAIPTEIPTELSLPPGATLPPRTDPSRPPPPLILPTSGQEPLPPPPKR
jgi:tetratricopeptide (TPR) repeat protein